MDSAEAQRPILIVEGGNKRGYLIFNGVTVYTPEDALDNLLSPSGEVPVTKALPRLEIIGQQATDNDPIRS